MIIDIIVHVDASVDFTVGILGADRDLIVTKRIADYIHKGYGNRYYNIFTMDTHYDNYLQTQEGRNLPVVHSIKNSDGWQLHNLVKEAIDDSSNNPKCLGNYIIEKEAFGTTKIGDTISTIIGQYNNEDVTFRIIFDGFDTDICVISCAITTKAMHPEIEHCLKEDCCAGYKLHDEAVAILKGLQFTIL